MKDNHQEASFAVVYRELFSMHLNYKQLHGIREALNQELVLGYSYFTEKIEGRIGAPCQESWEGHRCCILENIVLRPRFIQGGDFKSGFLAAGFTQISSQIGNKFGLYFNNPQGIGQRLSNALTAAVVGGTASKIGGGKFANGAVTGAFSRVFNDDGLHHKAAARNRLKTALSISKLPGGPPLEESIVRVYFDEFNNSEAVWGQLEYDKLVIWNDKSPYADSVTAAQHYAESYHQVVSSTSPQFESVVRGLILAPGYTAYKYAFRPSDTSPPSLNQLDWGMRGALDGVGRRWENDLDDR